ncbi:hypothetical protein F4778DRAFT_759305 [Xylariomycetidae sp. FL2044]|nr:hypothetical protein F4778DRAFT_759305 [Xylariomycetidae sp. FL2044]
MMMLYGYTTQPSTLVAEQKSILAMSRAQYFSHIRHTAAISAKTIKNGQATTTAATAATTTTAGAAATTTAIPDKLAVSVCIFQTDHQTSNPSVLLVRRSLRFQKYPGHWELPGGKVSDEDFCISAALARKVDETTGLKVVKVLGMLRDTRHVEEMKILEWDDDHDDHDGHSHSHGHGHDEGRNNDNGRGRRQDMSSSTRITGNNNNTIRKEHLTLNFTVRVESTEDGLRLKGQDHDAMAWAGFKRVQELKMRPEVRMVAHEALVWAARYFV